VRPLWFVWLAYENWTLFDRWGGFERFEIIFNHQCHDEAFGYNGELCRFWRICEWFSLIWINNKGFWRFCLNWISDKRFWRFCRRFSIAWTDVDELNHLVFWAKCVFFIHSAFDIPDLDVFWSFYPAKLVVFLINCIAILFCWILHSCQVAVVGSDHSDIILMIKICWSVDFLFVAVHVQGDMIHVDII